MLNWQSYVVYCIVSSFQKAICSRKGSRYQKLFPMYILKVSPGKLLYVINCKHYRLSASVKINPVRHACNHGSVYFVSYKFSGILALLIVFLQAYSCSILSIAQRFHTNHGLSKMNIWEHAQISDFQLTLFRYFKSTKLRYSNVDISIFQVPDFYFVPDSRQPCYSSLATCDLRCKMEAITLQRERFPSDSGVLRGMRSRYTW